jgi:hypothetical protein
MTHQQERTAPIGSCCASFIWVCFLGLFWTISGYIQVTVQAGNGIQHPR